MTNSQVVLARARFAAAARGERAISQAATKARKKWQSSNYLRKASIVGAPSPKRKRAGGRGDPRKLGDKPGFHWFG